jgi:hypothetical protein
VQQNSNHSIEYCIADIFNTFLGKNAEREEFYFKILPNILKDEFNLDSSLHKFSIFEEISVTNLFVLMQYHNKIYFTENLDINFSDKKPFIAQDIKYISPYLIMKWNLKASNSKLNKKENLKAIHYKFNKINNNSKMNKSNLSNSDYNTSVNRSNQLNNLNDFTTHSISTGKNEVESQMDNIYSLIGKTKKENINNYTENLLLSAYKNDKTFNSCISKENQASVLSNNNPNNNNKNNESEIKSAKIKNNLIEFNNKNLILNTNIKRIKNKNLKFENENIDVCWIINDFKVIEDSQEDLRLKLIKTIYLYLSEKQNEIALKLCDYYVQKYNETISLNPVIYIILAEIYNLVSGIELARLFYEKAVSIIEWQFPANNNPLLVDVLYSFSLILLKNVDSEEMLLEIEDLLDNCLKLCKKVLI